jgi:hypothetical protein
MDEPPVSIGVYLASHYGLEIADIAAAIQQGRVQIRPASRPGVITVVPGLEHYVYPQEDDVMLDGASIRQRTSNGESSSVRHVYAMNKPGGMETRPVQRTWQ